MAAKTPLEELPGPSTDTPPKLPSFSPNPSTTTTAAAAATAATATVATATSTVLRPPGLSPPSDVDVSHIPSYSRWFSWDNIHECELRFLPEFFDSRSPSKNPRVYMYYRNSIIKLFRENPARKITFTDARKTLVGDVGSIRRVFDFLDAWGLINYSPSASNKPLKWDDKESKATAAVSQSGEAGGGSGESSGPNKENSKRLCSGCKSLCSIACFACEKYDLTLCARCYVRGNYRVGVSSSDFRRVEISEEKTNWTDKETLLLLEALLQYSDDWKKVAQHVGGRSEKECVSQFIKLPFGEEFIGYLDSGEVNKDAEYGLENNGVSSPSKKMRLTPLADASNPIMAQAAFLSALAGEEIAEAAALAAVKSLSEVDFKASTESFGSLARNTRQKATDAGSNGDTTSNAFEGACLDANSLLDKEERDMQRAISEITEVHIPEIKDKIVRFEELDLLMEKELQQLEQMKNLLFLDQLNLLFENSSAPKSGEHMERNIRTD